MMLHIVGKGISLVVSDTPDMHYSMGTMPLAYIFDRKEASLW